MTYVIAVVLTAIVIVLSMLQPQRRHGRPGMPSDTRNQEAPWKSSRH